MFNVPLPAPNLQSNISLYQILTGFIIGLFLQPLVNSARLFWKYHAVTGRYSVRREHADGRIEAREGKVRIKFKWWGGYYSVTALHADNAVQWKGEMHLSLAMTNVGSGVFWHVDQEDGVGDQRFRYLPERRESRVQGTTFRAGGANSFFHVWVKHAQ
jgi:hypothetical protein